MSEEKETDGVLPTPPQRGGEEDMQVIFHGRGRGKENERDGTFLFEALQPDEVATDETKADDEFLKNNAPKSELEIVLTRVLERKNHHIQRLSQEMAKVKEFISKRKQTYKRKRKLDGAPTRALSAYNIFIKDRFAQLAKENEEALKSDNKDAKLMRVASSSLVAQTGNIWKELPPEEKAKYEDRAKADRKRYEEEMAAYQPPDKSANRKRNKTGYNMFFSSHVMRLKQTDSGVPSERGSVARLVGIAWKQLSAEEKQYYEREADKHNGANPVPGVPDEDDDIDEKHPLEHPHYYAQPDMHLHMAPPPPQMHHHDPRHHYYTAAPPLHTYGQQPYAHYDYSQHQRHQGRSQHGYQPPTQPPGYSGY